jgi:hypothetical protein
LGNANSLGGNAVATGLANAFAGLGGNAVANGIANANS